MPATFCVFFWNKKSIANIKNTNKHTEFDQNHMKVNCATVSENIMPNPFNFSVSSPLSLFSSFGETKKRIKA